MRPSVVISAVVAAFVGFGGTLALIVAAARAVGADQAQTSSWVAALCLAMAGTSLYLSLRHRIPVITAWSTPGAALIAAADGTIRIEAAVGAFLLAAALILATAAFRPIGRLIERIPAPVAAAMLAGVLLRFVVAVFESAQGAPALVLPLVALFLVVRLLSPPAAVLAVLVAGGGLSFALGLAGPLPAGAGLSTLAPIVPAFEPAVLIGLGLPLYLVTMASQNLPGFAVLRTAGYPVPSRSILGATGLASLLTAPFGAHTSNLAAITAALCTGPDAHPDPAKRWQTGPVYALCYLVLAAFGASLVGIFAALPGALIATVAGLALIGPLMGAMAAALAGERDRFAAVLTLAVTASGLSLLGIGSAFWGLVAGVAALALDGLARRLRPAAARGASA
ncbi:MAG TPA: benzoate/H(+) symporter BenE family transporter [Alphaproteobacteria bacterium]|nr:benzoate/H(+) symporter BenE family transporter [Alphaproteobacteria bacterium]